MIIFIVIFGTYAYWSLVKKMTFRMIMAAALNVWFGFAIGMALAYTLKFAKADQLAIMVETGKPVYHVLYLYDVIKERERRGLERK